MDASIDQDDRPIGTSINRNDRPIEDHFNDNDRPLDLQMPKVRGGENGGRNACYNISYT